MTKAVPSGFYVLRHPNHLLLAGVNNRNVALPNDSKQPLIKQIEIFSGILTVYFNCKYFPKYMRELLACARPQDFAFWAKSLRGKMHVKAIISGLNGKKMMNMFLKIFKSHLSTKRGN